MFRDNFRPRILWQHVLVQPDQAQLVCFRTRYQTRLVYVCVLNICSYFRSLNIEELCISSAKVPPFFGTVGSTIATDLMSMLLSVGVFSSFFSCFADMDDGISFLFSVSSFTNP